MTAPATPLHGLPTLKALPVVLLCRANLIRETEAVRPPFLLGAPATIPREVVDSGAVRRIDVHAPDEIGAARATLQPDPHDREVRLGRQHVSEQPPHLDTRREALDANVIRAAVRDVSP